MRKRRPRSALLGGAVVAVLALAGVLPASAAAQGDVSIDAFDSADPVTTATEFTYGLAVANAGPEAATGVTVEATLPNEVDFVSFTGSQGSCQTQGSKKVDCSLGTLGAGQSASVEIRVRAARDGQASMTARVASASPVDPDAQNDLSTEQTTIQAAPPTMCAGQEVTVLGTAGNDVLTGTDKADVFAGLGGDDEIIGLDGRDTVCGGLGNDLIKVGTDDDVAKGGGGNDRLRGSEGNDTLSGNGGNDNLGGGTGNDSLKGGPGSDRCRGGPGADRRRGCE